MASAAAAKILGAIFKIPLTNLLGGVGMGYFGCAYGLFLPIYAVSATGLSAAVAKLVSDESAAGNWKNVRRIRSTSRFIFAAFGTVLTAVIIFLSKPFAVQTTGDTSSWYAILMIAPSALFGCMSAVERGYYEGLQNMYPTAFSQAAEAVIKVICGLWLSEIVFTHQEEVLLFFPEGTDILSVAAAAAVLGVTLSTAAGLFYFIIRNIFGDGIRLSDIGNKKADTHRSIAKRLILTMLPITLGSVGATLTSVIDLCTVMRCIDYSQMHRMNELMERFGSIAAEKSFPAFVYGAFTGMALTVFNLVPSVTNMFGRSVLPCAARAFVNGRKDILREQVRSVVLAACLLAVPAGAGLMITAEPIMFTLYSGHSEEAVIAAQALAALSPGMVCLCLVTPLFSIMQGTGRADLPVKLMLMGVCIKTVGNILLIPNPAFAVTGAGISTSLCYGAMLIFSLIYLRRELGGNVGIIKTMLPVLYASALCSTAAYLMRSLFTGYSAFIQLSACIAGAVLIYALSLKLMGNSKESIRQQLSLRI